VTPDELREARADLGVAWGLGRPLKASELGRALGIEARDPGRPVLAWEAGRAMPRPFEVMIEMMLDGATPRRLKDAL
jgi:hypothetical protein